MLCLLLFLLNHFIIVEFNEIASLHYRENELKNEMKQIKSRYIVACYFTNWGVHRAKKSSQLKPENIDPFICTHIIYAFANLNGATITHGIPNDIRTYKGEKPLYPRIMKLKKKNPKLKILISVGGWHARGSFDGAVISQSRREAMAQSAIAFCKKHGFDGLDIDWEFPNAQHKQNFGNLIKTIRSAFEEESQSSGNERYELSIATAAGKYLLDQGYDIPVLCEYVDFVNIMTYDLYGQWHNKIGHHSTLYGRPDETGISEELNTNSAVKNWLDRGCPSRKIMIGIASYGRTYRADSRGDNKQAAFRSLGKNGNNGGMTSKYLGESGVVTYYEMCEMLEDEKKLKEERLEQESKGEKKKSKDYRRRKYRKKKGNKLKKSKYTPNIWWSPEDNSQSQQVSSTSGSHYNFKRYWHDRHRVPIAFDSKNQLLIGYDDSKSVSIKCRYVQENRLAGAFIWTLDMDDFDKKCESSKKSNTTFPLTRTMMDVLINEDLNKRKRPMLDQIELINKKIKEIKKLLKVTTVVHEIESVSSGVSSIHFPITSTIQTRVDKISTNDAVTFASTLLKNLEKTELKLIYRLINFALNKEMDVDFKLPREHTMNLEDYTISLLASYIIMSPEISEIFNKILIEQKNDIISSSQPLSSLSSSTKKQSTSSYIDDVINHLLMIHPDALSILTSSQQPTQSIFEQQLIFKRHLLHQKNNGCPPNAYQSTYVAPQSIPQSPARYYNEPMPMPSPMPSPISLQQYGQSYVPMQSTPLMTRPIDTLFQNPVADSIRHRAKNLSRTYSSNLAQLFVLNNLLPTLQSGPRYLKRSQSLDPVSALNRVKERMITTLPNLSLRDIDRQITVQYNSAKRIPSFMSFPSISLNKRKEIENSLSKYIGVDSNAFGSCAPGSDMCLVRKQVTPLTQQHIAMNAALDPLLPTKYRLTKVVRGGALFIGNSTFNQNNDLNGIDVDLKNFHRTFGQLGFVVYSLFDVGAEEMKQSVRMFLEECQTADQLNPWQALVIGISSHGRGGKIFGNDDEAISVFQLLDAVNNTITNRPKMVFIDACRSGGGPLGLFSINTDIPFNLNDVIVGYSSPPGEESLASDTGSYFFTVLHETLAEYGCCQDVASILEIVKQKMIIISHETGKNQINDTSNHLTKPLFLNPGFGVE
ncbi:hypothetical protein SNEBB_010021 [Seison nebaliae]|nr:hypothetical protein SNEBB_010021 [Seison nebaliae]